MTFLLLPGIKELIDLARTQKFLWSFIKRQASGTSSDKEWYNEWQQMTTSDSEWQRVITNDNKWQRMTTSDITSDNERKRMVTCGTRNETNESEWEQVKESDFGFRMKQNMQYITTIYSAI